MALAPRPTAAHDRRCRRCGRRRDRPGRPLPHASAHRLLYPGRKAPHSPLLPDWEASDEQPLPTPARNPSPLPHPSPTPSPSPLPPAARPPTRIVAPAIGIDAKVVPMGWETVDRNGILVSEWVIPEKAAGWHINSALPGHGENVVLSGHHNIEGRVFRCVVDPRPGDEITLYVEEAPYPYLIAEKHILKEAGMPLRIRHKNAQADHADWG